MNRTDDIDGLFAAASRQFQTGQLRLAEELYHRILLMHPDHPRALHALGVIAFRNGNEDTAVDFINKALSLRGDYADAHNSLGNILLKQGKPDAAAASYRNALAVNPELVIALTNLGNALRSMGDLDGAAKNYRRALALQPELGATHYSLGIVCRDLNRPNEAIQSLMKAVELMPASPDAHFQLGVSFQEQGQTEEAASCYRQAIHLKPDFADALNNLGNILAEMEQIDEARTCYETAVACDPGFFLSYNNLGNLLTETGEYPRAEVCYRKALELRPDYADAYSNLGNVLSLMDRDSEALGACRKAVDLDPDDAVARKILGNVLLHLGRHEEAAESFLGALAILGNGQEDVAADELEVATRGLGQGRRRPSLASEIHFGLGNTLRDLDRFEEAALEYLKAAEATPNYAEAYNNLGNIRKDQGRLEEALECYRKAAGVVQGCPEAHSNFLFAMNYSEKYSVRDILEESLQWDRIYGIPLTAKARPHSNPAQPDRKLGIGYVSADFGRHPVGYFLQPVLAAHDRKNFTAYCYSCGRHDDDITRRLRADANFWRDVAGTGDEELAEMIRSDGIDILVDLSGHTSGNRLTVFARKPAPVQVTWAGYVGTTGLSSMDYLISDPIETPEGVDHLYIEKIIRLPDDYVCYAPPDDAPSVTPLPMIQLGHVTFGCFNNLNKVNPAVVELWSELLKKIPDARLLLVTRQLNDEETRRRYLGMFSRKDVGDRVELSGSLPHGELLRRYNDVDISLDPFPYSGGLTTLESLWMGVPVITLEGERFAGRHSMTHLSAVGLQELIARSKEEYIEIATSVAGNPSRLRTMREGLRACMASSAVCDAQKFTRNLENAFRSIWAAWCSGSAR